MAEKLFIINDYENDLYSFMIGKSKEEVKSRLFEDFTNHTYYEEWYDDGHHFDGEIDYYVDPSWEKSRISYEEYMEKRDNPEFKVGVELNGSLQIFCAIPDLDKRCAEAKNYAKDIYVIDLPDDYITAFVAADSPEEAIDIALREIPYYPENLDSITCLSNGRELCHSEVGRLLPKGVIDYWEY